MELVMSKEAWDGLLVEAHNAPPSWTRIDAERLRVFLQDEAGTGRRFLRRVIAEEAELVELLVNGPMDTEVQVRQRIAVQGRRNGLARALDLIFESVAFDFTPDPNTPDSGAPEIEEE